MGVPQASNNERRLIIGRREVAALPGWGIKRVLAKTDTGAASSAIDVVHDSIHELPGDRVRFDVATSRKHLDRHVTVEAEIVRRATVKSSLGDGHDRLFVRTTLVVGPFEKEVEIGLVDRERMACRMLLGVSTLAPELLVDPSASFLLTEKPGRKRKVKKKKKKRRTP